MTLRWRQQELFFGSLIALFFLLKLSLGGGNGEAVAGTFSDDSGTTMVLAEMLPHLLIYAFFLLINAWLIPWRQGLPGFRNWLAASLLISWFIIASGIRIAYVHFVARDGVDVRGMNLESDGHRFGYARAGVIVILYSLYLLLRSKVSAWVHQRQDTERFRVLVINQLTLVIFILLSSLMFAWVFEFPASENFLVFTGIFVIPSVVLIYYNACFLLPSETLRNSRTGLVIAKLTLAAGTLTCIATIMASLLLHRFSLETFVLSGLVYLFIATPVSWRVWLILRNHRNSVLNLQADLGKTSADLRFLRSQVNPHFLFNALNTIYGIALQEEASRTADAAQRLGEMMRFMLQENGLDRIPLVRELEYLENYIAFQRLRIPHNETIKLEISICNGAEGSIAPMLLIPFVENAFKHGISFNRSTWIRLSVQVKEGLLQADFSNSLHPKQAGDTERLNTGVGLQNVRERLHILYPGKHELLIRENELEYVVHLSIQLN